MKPIFQQLLEAKSILLEDFEDDAKTIMGKDLAGAVASLKTKASDSEFQQGATSGKSDGADNDESADFATKPIEASKMFPTQKEIGFGKSLHDLCQDKYGAIDSAFGNPVFMPSPDGKIPIMCAELGGNIAILDGHHRWSSCFMINPDAKMACDIMKGDFQRPEDALKAMQFAIAAKAGKIATKGMDGKDLMTESGQAVEDYVLENIGEKEIGLFKKHKPELDSKEKIAKYVRANHAKIAKMRGAFPRAIMPQAGENNLDQGDVNKAIEKGEINFSPPYVKESSLKETLQRRAGIKK